MENFEAKISLKDSLDLIKDYCKKEYSDLDIKKVDYSTDEYSSYDLDYGSFTHYYLRANVYFDKKIGNISIECDKIIREKEIKQIMISLLEQVCNDMECEISDLSLPYIKKGKIDLDDSIKIQFRKIKSKVYKKSLSN